MVVNIARNFFEDTFPKATFDSCLLKLEEEMQELIHEVRQPAPPQPVHDPILEEYVDMICCLLHAGQKLGFIVPDISKALYTKIYINSHRKWQHNPNNTYSHIK